MDILLDTHVLLWWDKDDPKLPKPLRALLADPRHRVFVSAASIWEIAIKRESGKLVFKGKPSRLTGANGFESLSISAEHAEHAGELPRHHADPFDRVLIAQAVIEGLLIATVDRQFASYAAPTLGLV